MSKLAPEVMEDMQDMAVIGPGKMLAEARKKHALSQQEVADKLNFRVSLVSDIEAENFDQSLPETYNRGYLKNYAKLVDISKEDVLTSYDMLNLGKAQSAEMLSFSKGTVKEAENNLLMWISYLIVAVLIGLTVMWWLQDENRTLTLTTSPKPVVTTNTENVAELNQATAPQIIESSNLNKELDAESIEERGNSTGGDMAEAVLVSASDSANDQSIINPVNNDTNEVAQQLVNDVDENSIKENNIEESNVQEDITNITEFTPDEAIENDENTIETPSVAVTFTFSGDCWVNIYDATGERIAWGIKKLGYVMNINGQAPFNVTLGKPELVAVNFDGQAIDMSQFRAGQIAKFSLPVTL